MGINWLFAGAALFPAWQAGAQSIEPPREGGLGKSQRAILRPGEDKGQAVESNGEREQRLQNAGVVPTPPPPPVPIPERLQRERDKIANEAKTEDDGQKAIDLRVEMDGASWFHLVKPKGTKDYTHDFSYGIGFLYPIEALPVPREGWSHSLYVGPIATFFNAGVRVNVFHPDWQRTVPAYADTTASEWGGAVHYAFEQALSATSSWTMGVRFGHLPLRWVKARDYSMLELPRGSDARSHFSASYTGFLMDYSASYTWARLLEQGAFVSLNGAWPWQIRARIGLRFALLMRSQ